MHKQVLEENEGLAALDLSFNQFTDDLAEEMYPILQAGPPLTGKVNLS